MRTKKYRRVKLYGSLLWGAVTAATWMSEGGMLAKIGSRAAVGAWIIANGRPAGPRERCSICRVIMLDGSYAAGGGKGPACYRCAGKRGGAVNE